MLGGIQKHNYRIVVLAYHQSPIFSPKSTYEIAGIGNLPFVQQPAVAGDVFQFFLVDIGIDQGDAGLTATLVIDHRRYSGFILCWLHAPLLNSF